MKFESTVGEQTVQVELTPKTNAFTAGEIAGNYEFVHQNGRYLLRLGTKVYIIDNIQYSGSQIEFSVDGNWHTVSVRDEQELLLDELGFKTGDAVAEGTLKSPMPGKILDIMVKEGDTVEKDQPLVILEAMKMENELKAPIAGTIESVDAEVGSSLEKNEIILEIKALG